MAAPTCSRLLGADDAQATTNFRISVVTMTGAAIVIDDASAKDTIGSIKARVFLINRKLHGRRQRLMYRPGPRGIEPLADDETLGDAGVAQDGSAVLDLLLAELANEEDAAVGNLLLGAASEGRLDDMLELLDEGADIEFLDPTWQTPLLRAAANGHVKCVRRLLEAGANKEASTRYGSTALLQAASNDHPDCVRVLLEAGANKEVTTIRRTRPLFFATRSCTRLLLDAGADMEARDELGCTVLHYASFGNHPDRVRMLLDAGANKKAKDENGTTALMEAAQYDNLNCVQLLLDAGVDKAVKDEKGRTALDWAREGTGVAWLIKLHSLSEAKHVW